ncbi:MAG TPA: hypothetical protein VGC00_11435 [Thermoanaerobaculia bacterium]|jgi:hypothetical protein
MKHRVSILVLALSQVLAGAGHAAQDLDTLHAEIVGLYAEMHAALADDAVTMVETNGGKIAVKAASAVRFAADPVPYQRLSEVAGRVAEELEIEQLREAFKGLSMALAALVESGQLGGTEFYYCPMADGYWAQKTDDAGVKNPYYGKSMLKCGSKVEKVEG